MKKFSDILNEFLAVRSPGDQKFLDDHPVEKHTGPAGSPEADDKLFNASNIVTAGKPGKGPAEPKQYKTVKASEGPSKAVTTTEQVSDEIIGQLVEGAYEDTLNQIKMIKKQLMNRVGDPGNLNAQLVELRKKRNLLAARASDAKEEIDVELDASINEDRHAAYQACDHAHAYTRYMDQHIEHSHRAEAHAAQAGDKNADPKLKKFHAAASGAHGDLANAMKSMADTHLEKLGDAHKKAKK